MTDLALGKHLSRDDLGRFLHALLPGVHVEVLDDGEVPNLDFDVHVSIELNASEFPLGLCILVAMRSGRDMEAWLGGVARALSNHFDARSICDGTRYGDSRAPYWSLIWDQGVAYLADDCDSLFADGEGGAVRVVRPLGAGVVDVPAVQELADWVRPVTDP